MTRNIFLNGLMMNEIEDLKHVTPTEFKSFGHYFAINISSLQDYWNVLGSRSIE